METLGIDRAFLWKQPPAIGQEALYGSFGIWSHVASPVIIGYNSDREMFNDMNDMDNVQ
jgi:hypothetical protein